MTAVDRSADQPAVPLVRCMLLRGGLWSPIATMAATTAADRSADQPDVRFVRRMLLHGRAVVADCDDGCAALRQAMPNGGLRAIAIRAVIPAGTGSCGHVWHRGPLSCLFALFSPNAWCGPSCGQRYWGDFYSDPPDCHDPCDCYGNYSGGGGGGGCRSCGGSAGHTRNYVASQFDDGTPMTEEEGELVPQADRVVTPAARQAGTPHKAPLKSPSP